MPPSPGFHSQAVELGSRRKELSAATSKREQLETLLEKAEGSQAIFSDLQNKVSAFETVRAVRNLLGTGGFCIYNLLNVTFGEQVIALFFSLVYE